VILNLEWILSHNDILSQPKYSCIEEWDTIHAMWLYEMMELSDAEEDANDHWRPTLRTKGMNLPILLKVSKHAEKVILGATSELNR
jgi:hypothetical protein